MNEQLVKSLTDLIDETLAEIDEIKKSQRFSAAEVELKGPGEGIAGKPSNGKLDKDEEGDEDEEDKKKKKEEAEKAEADEAAKAEGKDADADDDADDEDEDDKKKGSKAHQSGEKKDIKSMADREGLKVTEKSEPKEGYAIKKSEQEFDTLVKSAIDARVKPLEDTLNSILGLVKELADAPVAPRGVPAGRVAPLSKSADEVQPLSKSALVDKMLDLKKSGTQVDSLDITKAELGGPAALQELAKKYNLK